ncbi:hypothetical protein, partial [Candidatus Hakubella thermalkaliphila]|uniref:hypothetical protein n=1 Tax=Candidatus Hakubella thermalkaliphila TaxID=2754717 RepID=UPI001C6121AA
KGKDKIFNRFTSLIISIKIVSPHLAKIIYQKSYYVNGALSVDTSWPKQNDCFPKKGKTYKILGFVISTKGLQPAIKYLERG